MSWVNGTRRKLFVAQCWLSKKKSLKTTCCWIYLPCNMDFSYCSLGYYPLNILCITIISVVSCEIKFFILQTALRLAARQSAFHFLPKKFTYLVWCLICCIKWFCCSGFIFVVRTILCCHVRSLLASPLRFWVLFCVLFLSMCLCKLQICAGCSELLLWSPWVWLDAYYIWRRFPKG